MYSRLKPHIAAFNDAHSHALLQLQTISNLMSQRSDVLSLWKEGKVPHPFACISQMDGRRWTTTSTGTTTATTSSAARHGRAGRTTNDRDDLEFEPGDFSDLVPALIAAQFSICCLSLLYPFQN